MRVCRRIDGEAVQNANQLLDGKDLVPIDRQVVQRASIRMPLELRSLDVIHLGSALSLRAALDAFVADDVRLCAAAAASGLQVASSA
jgi:hypothetical protein